MLAAQYEWVHGIEGRCEVRWMRSERGQPEKLAGVGRTWPVAMSDRNCHYRAVVVPVAADGEEGAAVASEPFAVDDGHMPVPEAAGIALTPPDSVIEDMPCFVRYTGKSGQPPDGAQCVIEMSVAMPKRCRLVWTFQGRVIAEGQAFTPRRADLGKEFAVELCDRIKEQTVARCELPAVTGGRPVARDLAIAAEPGDSALVTRFSAIAAYSGGTEGRSVVAWFAGNPNGEAALLEEGTRRWIELGTEYVGKSLWFTYEPVSDREERGIKVRSEPVTVRLPVAVRIVDRSIVINPEWTEFRCTARTDGPGRLSFTWAYRKGDAHHSIGSHKPVHVITARDCTHDVCCVVDAATEAGQAAGQVLVCMEPPLRDRLRPRITGATIRPVADRANRRPSARPVLAGQELEVVRECAGPPVVRSVTMWQRAVGGDEWQDVCEGDRFVPAGTDVNRRVRAIVSIVTRVPALDTEIESEPFRTDPVVIGGGNPVIERLASTLRRSGKTQFDATLLTGEAVVVAIEGQDARVQFVIRAGSGVLHKAELRNVAVEVVEGSTSAVSITAGYGYRTELSIARKKMPGGMDFSAPQARDLFVEAVKGFRPVQARKSPAGRQRKGQP
jgi:hypothetical protein